MPFCITCAADLVTSRAATCQGFLKQAVKKTEKAAPHVAEATMVWQMIQPAETPQSLIGIPSLRESLASIAGISDKAMNHLVAADVDAILSGLFAAMPPEFQLTFKEELFYRYLLTHGDSLGGEMRNWVGAEAQRVLNRAILRALAAAGKTTHATFPRPNGRVTAVEAQYLIAEGKENKIQIIEWPGRCLAFDKKPAFSPNSIDAILLDMSALSDTKYDRAHLANQALYLACGELKGGIDPAGADEHWKTASEALNRTRRHFADSAKPPGLFFVGAAIQDRMANDIFGHLTSGTLARAANLTVAQQVDELAAWLVSL